MLLTFIVLYHPHTSITSLLTHEPIPYTLLDSPGIPPSATAHELFRGFSYVAPTLFINEGNSTSTIIDQAVERDEYDSRPLPGAVDDSKTEGITNGGKKSDITNEIAIKKGFVVSIADQCYILHSDSRPACQNLNSH